MKRKLNGFFRGSIVVFSVSLLTLKSFGQELPRHDSLTRHIDTTENPADSVLRIKNLNPYFTLHVDSLLQYPLEINKDQSEYYWYLRNSPIGVRINKDN